MFKNPFSFSGRIRRLEFGISYIIYFGVLFMSTILNDLFSTQLMSLLIIPALWFLLAQGSKRCHDRGNSGFYLIIPFYVLWMVFAESEFGENEYTNDPNKGIPTSACYRFRFSLSDDGMERVRRNADYLVPNIKEYGWSNTNLDPSPTEYTTLSDNQKKQQSLSSQNPPQHCPC